MVRVGVIQSGVDESPKARVSEIVGNLAGCEVERPQLVNAQISLVEMTGERLGQIATGA